MSSSSSSSGAPNTSAGSLSCDSSNSGNENLPNDCIYRYFLYNPNEGANIFFLVFFILLTIAIGYQAIRSKQYWLHSLTLFGALEAAGYIARLQLIESPSKSAFTGELVILILSPNCLAFCCYVVLGKIITYVFQTHSDGKTSNWLTRHPAWVPTFYLCSDILCIVVQGIGGAILSGANNSKSQLDTGKAVELVGLALQLFFIATFLLICRYVWRTMRTQSNGAELTASLTPAYAALMVIIGLLVVRNIYRVGRVRQWRLHVRLLPAQRGVVPRIRSHTDVAGIVDSCRVRLYQATAARVFEWIDGGWCDEWVGWN